MSNRITLVNVVLTAGFADLKQITELIPQWHSQKIKDTIRDCVKAGLIERTMDSGELCYAVTTKGKQWQKDQTGDYVTAPEDAEPVVVPPPPDYEPEAVCFDAKKREAAKDAEIEKLRSIIDLMSEDHHKATDLIATLTKQRDAWREMGRSHGSETPDGITQYIAMLSAAAESAETALAMAIEAPIKDDANKDPVRGYIVADVEDDTGPVFQNIEYAKIVAVVNTATSGKRAGVFAMLNVVESVDVKWASQSPKVFSQVAGA
jgi:hypothetical protein